ncbi:MAG: Stk1 family PASTA domain-containing Ser/Thr kinase [Oscillospiraceae bacterium]|nr:Stk1 family PASTA domain-containing Ser/Thr kinase [Oscillospiraceae bacterium]
MNKSDTDKYIGRRLDGRYQIDRQIGVGGMSYVYKATDLNDGSTVAVKILKDEYAGVTDLVRRFRNESKAVRMLSHENIVKVLDVNYSDSVQYIVMEYLEGITLKQYMEKYGVLNWKQTVSFSEQLLKALQHAHDRGIVHRDMKPQNVMITRDGKLKVMDFGIARFSRSSLHTITDKAIGTVHYISPEQAKGDETDSRADIYSVGVMMYEMCTGKLPFDADSPVSIALMQISEQAKNISDINPDVPDGLQRIIEKAMEKDPNNRYQSAGAMLTELEHFRKNPEINFDYKSNADQDPAVYISRVAQKRTAAAGEKTEGKESEMAKKETTKQEAPKKAKTKKEKPLRPKTIGFGMGLLMGLTLICLLGSMFLVYMTLKNAGSSIFTTPEEVELPDFAGESIRSIQSSSEYSKFRFSIEEEFDPNVPIGTVISQVPKPPKTVKDNARITLYVSKGVEVVTVPAIVGESYGNAVQILQDLGLIVYRELDKNDEFETNQITRTDPEVGSSVEAGSVIKIYVNSPVTSLTTSVPNLVGQKAAEAIAALISNGLNKGEVTMVRGVQEGHEDIEPGCVVIQSIKGGTRVAIGTTVNITVREELAEKECTFKFDAPFSDPSGNMSMTAQLFADGESSASYNASSVSFTGGITVTAKGADDKAFLIKINGVDYRKVLLNFQEGTSKVVADYSRSNGFVMEEPSKYLITGKVADGSGTVTASSDEVYSGRTAEVTITPADGYKIVSVTDNGSDVTSHVSGGKYTISNVTENHTVTAWFGRNEYTVTVSVEHGSGSTSKQAYYGDTLVFSVSPDEGFEFESASGGSYSNGTLTVTNVTGNINITVKFRESTPPTPPENPEG